jgi:hypothetical protein
MFAPRKVGDSKDETQTLTKPDGYKSSQASSAVYIDPSGNLIVKQEKSNSEEEKSND